MNVAKKLTINGRVQAVGFRPFIYRIANNFGLRGNVFNGSGIVHIHVEGEKDKIEAFTNAIIKSAPPLARPYITKFEWVTLENYADFQIIESVKEKDSQISVPPDLFLCDDCIEEIENPDERRYRYPFTNCTQCGPRYTIIKSLPYDRINTSLSEFPICKNCATEYENPADRRFHAEPLACETCGPHLIFEENGSSITNNEAAIAKTIDALKSGKIIATKGIGGYHLLCDAKNDEAVLTLRKRKNRPDKPLAIMFPTMNGDLTAIIKKFAKPTQIEIEAITAPERPIVLIERLLDTELSPHIAKGLLQIGVFLPYSPLHHLILKDFGGPIVATSGNISGEPVIFENSEARDKLSSIADCFLHHNREILRPADDSVIRIIANQPRPIRLGRGFAPFELENNTKIPLPMIATGGQMKNAVALASSNKIIIAPHIGELDSARSIAIFEQIIQDIQNLYSTRAKLIACDSHPQYGGTKWASATNLPVIKVQHHKSHASAVAGEYAEVKKWLIFSWDGVGLGDDGVLWGGEAFVGTPANWCRVGSIREFKLLGGDKAGRQPWRSAAGLMWATGHEYSPDGLDNFAKQAWNKNINCFNTSAGGRLFDAAAALIIGREYASFEGQGPMELEALYDKSLSTKTPIELKIQMDEDKIWRLDWEDLLPILTDTTHSKAQRATWFHDMISDAMSNMAKLIAQSHDFDAIGLCGGVFQNRILCESLVAKNYKLQKPVYIPQKIPMNDGGLAFGQIIEASAMLAKEGA